MPIGATGRATGRSRSFFAELLKRLNIIRNDDTYNADYGDFVFSNGGTVVLPEPDQNALIGIGSLDGSRVSIDPGQATVDGNTDPAYRNTEPLYLYSDGSSWIVATDYAQLIPDIPDIDLTQYQITDTDNEITVNSASAYDFASTNTANTEARMYQTGFSEVGDGILEMSFDISINAYTDFARHYIGFSSDEDGLWTNVSDFVGIVIGREDFGLVVDTSNDNPENLGSFSAGNSYTLSATIDFGAGDVTAKSYDSNGDQIEQQTLSFSGGDFDVHYAFLGRDASFSNPGELDENITNMTVVKA